MSSAEAGTWTLLTTADGKVHAHLLCGRLRQDGIDAVLDDSNPSPGAWLMPFGDPSAPVRVLVATHQLEWAQLILNDAESSSRRDVPAQPDSRVRAWWGLVAVAATVLILLKALSDGSAIGF